MKVARFSRGGDPAFGILDEESDELVVLRSDPMFAGYDTTGERVALADVRLLAPVIPRSKVIGFDGNYAEDADAPVERPRMILKPNTSVVGPGDFVQLPEVEGGIASAGELAIIVGRIAKQVPEERAEEVVFGYTIANNVSLRTPAPAESAVAAAYDTFCPLGPVIATEVDIRDLDIRTVVDGASAGTGNTGDMLFSIPRLIAFASEVFTLLPGDVILTGAPAAAVELGHGATVEITVDGIGTLSNPARHRD